MPKTVTAVLIAIILLFSGCDIFNTRDPEKPKVTRSTFDFPSTPQIAISNLKYALLEKNVQNYTACFVDSNFSRATYLFIPAASSASVFPLLNTNWNVKSEDQYFTMLIGRLAAGSGIELAFSSEKIIPYSDSTLFTAGYSLSVPYNKAATPSKYTGEIHLTFRLDSRGEWVISSWQDISLGSNACWSDVKGENYH